MPSNIGLDRRRFMTVAAGLVVLFAAARANADERHFLYVAEPGVRDYVEWGGAGILVFDIDNGHSFVRRIETPASREAKPDNIKGVCANAATKRLYFTTTKRLYCLDLLTEQTLWEKPLPQGCDRLAVTPDGKTLYVPSLERDIWNVVDAATGDVHPPIVTKSGSHNTVCGLNGDRMYLAGLKSPILTIADPRTHQVVARVGPFAAGIRPFTVNAAQTRVYVNVNDLLGFEIGDLTTGKKLARVEVQGYERGPVKRHSCPSHGIGLTPDETELWVADAHNSRMHVFDLTADAPKQIASLPLREQPGWVTFSLDGRYAYPSTGEVFDVKSKALVVALKDEKDRPVHSEKLVEIDFKDGTPVRVGDQVGLGRATKKQ
jgi:DNA-binding beta-propeller fold protein YncE